jgi:hypothetical protein
MKIDFTKDWCVRMAQMEMDAGTDMEIGATPEAAITGARAHDVPAEAENAADSIWVVHGERPDA